MSAPSGLIGRRSECGALDRLLADVRAQRSGAVVLRGEPGIGKTALLDHLAANAEGCRVVRAAGVECEMELAFSGLHQVCAPMLHRVDHLPGPQADALRTAFGVSDGEAADRFLVGLAALSLLASAAEREPVVCLIDDVQWMDQVSAQILAFVARRLLAESVALVFTLREPSDVTVLDGLPELAVTGLSNDDAKALLEVASPGRLDEQVLVRIVAETRGNPLALLELPRELTAGELSGGFALPEARPMATRLEHSFASRVEALPASTRQLLLVAAAEPLGDGALLRRAADHLGIAPDAGAEAEDDGLIELGPRVRFRHPLVRSAAYRVASAADRRRTHEALAAATDRDEDPDRQAWHRAHAATGPDDAVAADLERSAGRAKSRGGLAASAAFLERSAQLTTDPALRAERMLAAAEDRHEAGAFDAAEALVASAELARSSDLQAARLTRLRAEIAYARQRGSDDPARLLDAAIGLVGLDDPLARETFLEAIGAAVFAGRLGTDLTIGQIAEAARAAPPMPDRPRPLDLMLAGLTTRYTDGYAAAAPELQHALVACRGQAQEPDGGVRCSRWFWLAFLLAGELWDDAAWGEVAEGAVRVSRHTGALGLLPLALNYRASVHLYTGEPEAAEALIEEASALTAATGYAPLEDGSGLVLAWRGDEAECRDFIDRTRPTSLRRGEGRPIGLHGYMAALIGNGHARYVDAVEGALQACAHDDLLFKGFALVELVEAAARAGIPEVAGDALAELEVRCRAAGTNWAMGLLARSHGLVTEGEAAEVCFRESIDRLGRSRIVVHLGRAHLVYGEWLRRQERAGDAREQLRLAYEILNDAGVGAFAERARRELVAAGETARRRNAGQHLDLTPQEAQIARLAAGGRTNPEIGGELFISPRTVEYHLAKVFTKLGLRSRRDPRKVLALQDQ